VRFRFLTLILLAALAVWIPFTFAHVNRGALWLAIPFLAANALLAASLLVGLVNNWHRSTPRDRLVVGGSEPPVAVIIPTAGESPRQVRATIASVMAQDWPAERLLVLISDDAHSDDLRALAAALRPAVAPARLEYHRPPPKGSPARRGEAKAGNLNSAVDLLDLVAPEIEFLETRDADDLVGDPTFLRRCIAQLAVDDRVAFVQTIKEARVSRGDPFDNLQLHFFRGAMYARNAANAVFPCGSGLVWRRSALEDIGRFPTWNLVEDLQSGVEALRRGWRGLYLPIVGAVGQHAPEDLPNAFKQRGTWALDTLRLLLWGDLRGLSFRQRLHFAELGLFYLQSFATLVFIACPVIGFAIGSYPLSTTYGDYALHFWPFAVVIELYLAALAAGAPYETMWRARVMWVGMAPVYAKACILALLGGRNRKPVYRVTRKHDEHRWYWRETLVQSILLVVLVAAAARTLVADSLLYEVDLGSMYWSAFFALSLACFVRLSWFGVRFGARARPRRTPADEPVPAPVPAPVAAE
jgi:cellulose synthase (UDP-forming)